MQATSLVYTIEQLFVHTLLIFIMCVYLAQVVCKTSYHVLAGYTILPGLYSKHIWAWQKGHDKKGMPKKEHKRAQVNNYQLVN